VNWRTKIALAYTLLMPPWTLAAMWFLNDTEGWELCIGIYLFGLLFFWTYGRDKDRQHEAFMRELEAEMQRRRK
jgi:type VI protein secretion system component VasK